MMDFNLIRKSGQKISILNDPFAKQNITTVFVHYRKNDYNGKWSASGSVSFQSGNTKGEQRFEGKDFQDVTDQITAFIQEFQS